MRALRAMLLLLPIAAPAGWRPVSTVAPPVRDVQVVDAGVVLAVSATGVTVWQVTDAGVAVINQLDGGSFVGGGFYGANCVLGLTGGLVVTPSSAACGVNTTISGTGNATGFKLLSAAPFAVAAVNTGSFDNLFSGPGAAPGWLQQNPSSSINGNVNRSLQTRRIAGIDYVAMNTGAPIAALYISVDGGLPSVVANTPSWRDAAPLPMNGAPAVLGVTGTGLVLLSDYRTSPPVSLSIPAGTAPRAVSSSGRASMATTTTGVVLAPVPNPARPLQTWVVRSGPDGGVGGKVHCLDDRACVSSNDAGVIWLWTNDEAPTVSFVVAPLADGGLRLAADAGDGDGDPLFVSWDAGPGAVVSALAGIDDGTQVDLTTLVCADLTIQAVVTDGLPGHERSVSQPLPVRGELVVTGSAPSVPAGGGPLFFSAFIDGGSCLPNTIDWSTSDGGTGSGSGFSWTPPLTECNADGGLVTITATATWPSGQPATTTVSRQVVVEPWGGPFAPSFTTATQLPNTTADYLSSGLEHQCSGSPGFPGTELVWTIDAGGAGVTEIDGGLRVVAPQTCVDLQVSASAYRRLVGQPSQATDAGTLVVNIPADLAPLPASTEFFLSVGGDGGVLFGVLKVDAGCLGERGVTANVVVFDNGTRVSDGDFPPPLDGGEWTWRLPLIGGCQGGTFDVVADLLANTGPTGAQAQGSITLPFSPVIVGAQTVTQLDVVCGAGARSTVALIPEPAACAAASVHWSSSGPALVTPSGLGESFELQTQALDFSVVGQEVAIAWSADAGAGNADSATHTITLGVQPFLTVDVKSRPPLRREEEAMTLEITLANSTSCAADGVSVLLPLSGGAPIAESVLIDGVKSRGRSTDLGLVVDGVTVPGDGKTTLQVSVRPRLLSSPTVEPVASLNGYVVSTRLPAVAPATGCGCSTAELSMMLGALLIFVRRRRA